MFNLILRRELVLPFISVIAIALAGCASPGMNAVQHQDAAQMQQILDQPNHGNENLQSLLGWSIAFDCMDCARVLLKMGVKTTPDMLAGAAENGKEKFAALLMDYGAESGAAITVIRSQTREWVGGCCLSPEQAQDAFDVLKKAEHDREARPMTPAPVVPPSSTPAVVAAQAETEHPRASPLFHNAERPNDYALIVGIEKYDDLPAATYAGRDAAAATDFVEAMGVPAGNVVTLTDSHATRSGLAKKLEGWLANNVNDNSTVYFYYSGHGAPDTKTGQAYLVPFDGDPEYLDQTAYPLKRVYEKLGALKAKRVIVMLDSCFSGAGGRSVLAKGARPLVSNVDVGSGSIDAKITVLAAAGAEQISGTTDEKGHGLFSYYLFNGLNGGAKDASGRVTVQSLFDYLKPKVVDDAHRTNREQVPQLEASGAGAGDVVLREK